MGIFETFSKRRKRLERAGQPDVYQYDTLPKPFRVQVVQICFDAIGRCNRARHETIADQAWEWIHDTLSREAGIFRLTSHDSRDMSCAQYLLEADTLPALDFIEVAFFAIDKKVRGYQYGTDEAGIKMTPNGAIAELNHRFREHGIGYEFNGGQLNRKDSEYVHAETVVPAIALLHNPKFRGPSDEFMRAHKHYREGSYKEAINEALKAFESTMKAICDARGWTYPGNATAKGLLDILLQNGLVPKELESEFGALRSALESGLPTVRNKMSGHGQGSQPVIVPAYLAGFALHLAAANIVFLVEAHKGKQ